MVKIYEIGGKVRDSFIGRENKDIDYAMEIGSYEEMREYILANGGKIYLETPQYQTIRCKMPNLGNVDFVLCRKDGVYSDGRRPDSVEIGNIYDDLARREITINAIARDVETGEILDPHGGRADIERRLIRAVGNAEERFNEDPLRLLRAMRFSVTLGFDIHEDIKKLLNAYHGLRMVETVSTDRIKDELNKMFRANTLRTLMTFEEFPGISSAIFGEGGTGLWLKVTNEKR